MENARERGELVAMLLADGKALRQSAWEPVVLSTVLPNGEVISHEVEPSPKDRLAAFQAVNASLSLDEGGETSDTQTAGPIRTTAVALGLGDDGE